MRALVLGLSLLLANPTLAEQHPAADQFIDEVVAAHGLDRSEVERLLNQAERKQSILDAISRPAEGMPWHRYRKIFITESRINEGVEFVRQHRQLLERVEAEYQVPIHNIAGIIGVETKYGTITGSYRVLDALATLAFHYPPRSAFFRGELEELLLLGRDERLDLTELKGSYAGAMGMGQFIPSSYRAYAVDFDGDGSRNLFGSAEDAIASVANYLHVHHWKFGEPVVAATTPGQDARELADPPIKPQYPVRQLIEWGYAPATSQPEDRLATIIELEGVEGPEHWVGFNNFYVITRYNRSPLYAMAVHQLSEAIAEGLQAAAPSAP